MNDYIKWTMAGAIIVVGIASGYVGELPYFVRVLSVVSSFIFATLLAATTAYGKKTWAFVLSAQNEAKKVVWPTRQETIQASIVVIIMVIIMSIVFWGFDTLLFRIMAWITGQEV